MTRTGVIGHPVGHSKSPLIHGYWMKQCGIDGTYDAIDIAPESLEEGINTLIKQGYKGFNVTIPHKADMIDLCARIDDPARAAGAVNTVTIKNGRLYGTNTDIYGFAENIRKNAPADFDFHAGPALVLGAGGAARAVVESLLEHGVPEIRLANRTPERMEVLLSNASEPGHIQMIDWTLRDTAQTLGDLNLLVNATALGMQGAPELHIDLRTLPKFALVNDIVYAPLITPLLRQAKSRGNPVVTGIGMLLHQARPAFKLWHGVMPEVTDELEKAVLGRIV